MLFAVGAVVSARAANFSEVYSLALGHDAQYAAARQTYSIVLEKYQQARALNLPSLTLSASLRGNRDYSSETDLVASYGSHSTTLLFSQPIFRVPNVIGAEQAELQARAAEQQLRQAELDLLVRVGKTYFDILQAQDSLSNFAAQVNAFRQQLSQARRSLEIGTVAITDLNEAQTKYDLAVAQELAGRNDLEIKSRALERIVGGKPPTLDALDRTRVAPTPPTEELELLRARAVSENAGVVVARLNRDIAAREVRKLDFGHAPSVDLTAQASRSQNLAAPGSLFRYNTYSSSVGFEISIPLYMGGAISSRQREAAAALAKSEADLDNAQRQAAFDADQAFLGMRSGAAQVTALGQALMSSEAQLRSTQKGAEVGTRIRLDVLNAEQQVFATRRDLAAATYQRLLYELQLRVTANTFSDADLKKLDALLRSP
jgi:outer membrane protein